MKTSPEFLAFVLEQLEPMRGVSARRLFGGCGLSVDGHTFALLIDNVLYFTVDDTTRPLYEAMGSPCFSYATRLRRVLVRSYHAVPAEVLEDRDRMLPMARQAVEVGLRKPLPGSRRKR